MTEAIADPESAGWRRAPVTGGQRRADALGAVALFLLGILSLVLARAIGMWGGEAAAPAVSLGVLAVITLPLAWRRRAPSVVGVIVSVAFIVSGELRAQETLVANIALFCAIYTVGAWEPNRRRAFLVRVVVIAAMGIWLIVGMFRVATVDLGFEGSGLGALTPDVGFMLQNLLINVLYFAGAYWFGERTWNAAHQRAILNFRTTQLAASQERIAQQAVAIERLRIARELHDAVAHHVSLMGVQAAAARSVLPRDTDGATAQLVALEDSARAAVGELYALLGTLRDAEDPAAQDAAAPILGVEGLPALAAEAESAGLQVSLDSVGTPSPVPALVGLNLYRITQEALANVLKHAGPGTRVSLRVRYLPSLVELEVADDGAGRPRPSMPGAGLGLPGMRERVATLRGQVSAEPRSTGGYVVRAAIPLPTSPPAVDAPADEELSHR
ncbi:sensor histidine kinase [Epidermidibacterium keratini]|uniref:histidine kinase n=1 Tax=Epidermidibacterium keratini TaxID=1891644 RepID=A0A7L4YPD7_9ACTN|nr:histidine kinase [Epidermidibacterium keratini]QHC01145.1 sensor histidine kinase [Epidermidibacterium keratini]